MTVQTRPATDSVSMVDLRPPEQVMRLERIGAFFQTRISFMRTLVRRMHDEAWRFEIETDTLDEHGYGRFVQVVHTPDGPFSFVAFSHHLDPQDRTDRVIAEAWDATFTLVDGRVDGDDLDRLERVVPKQEAGQCSARELVLSRANKSVRLFEHVVSALAEGKQPDIGRLAEIGYLMRTTAVYGNGKFGLGDFAKLAGRSVLNAPFQAELLTVYLIRHFSIHLAEHVARQRSPETAAPMAAPVQRMLGIGNATGLGMAPFLIKHPILIDRWITARETALARVRAVETADARIHARFDRLLARAIAHVAEWNVEDEVQQSRILVLRDELDELAGTIAADRARLLPDARPWDRLFTHMADTCSIETQELAVSLLLELYPALVDELEREMASDDIERIAPTMTLGELASLIETDYAWALEIDFDQPEGEHYFWYYSEGKEEPRRGARGVEPGAECEMRLGFGRDVSRLHGALRDLGATAHDETVAAFLLRAPQWRAVVRRIQTLKAYPYGEIRDNLLARDCRPIDLLRCKLSYFGATKFDPKSDLWTRITMYQGAPLIDELDDPNADDWAFPVAPDDVELAR